MNILLTITLTFIFSITSLADDFDKQKPDDLSDASWASLKSAVQQAKLLPEPAGIGGENSQFGRSVSVDGNRALVGAPSMAGTGAVLVFEFDGINWQEVEVLQPVDGEQGDYFGYSVSQFGDRVLVGAYGDDDHGWNSGSVYVFEYDGISWKQNQKLTASDESAEDQFGVSVSLSGNRALVGANGDDDNGYDSGSAYIFDYDGMSWTQSQKLNAVDAAAEDNFSSSVSLSGVYALVGASGDDDNGESTGSAYIFEYDGISWTQRQKLTANDGYIRDLFGFSVSLSGDNALIGAYGDDDNGSRSGSAYVFHYDGVNWVQSQKLVAGDGAEEDRFGISVNLSGNRALIGAYFDDDIGSASGSAYIFDYDGMSWMQSQKLSAGDGAANDWFGGSVGLSGNRAWIGAYGDNDNGNDSGSAYIFTYDGMSWTLSQKLTKSDGAAEDQFGISVSLSGSRALVGAYGDDDNGDSSGSAYIFDYDGMSWIQSQKLTTSDGSENNFFGYSVSLYGDRALVGAYGDDDNGDSSGSAYIFDFIGGVWVQTAKLTAVDGVEFDLFGISVSLSGDRALVGANGDDDNGIFSGSAYIFDYNGLSWVQSQKLIAEDAAIWNLFGYSVSLSGNRALVGAPSSIGSAYIFNFDGMSWSQVQKLTARDRFSGDKFGWSVSLHDNRALVGAYGDDDNGNNSGSAYVFDFDGMNWSQSAKLIASDGEEDDRFGYSVSLDGDIILVGAFSDISYGLDLGSAYIFSYNGGDWSQRQKLTVGDSKLGDEFGSSVSVSGDRALIGAPADDDFGTNSGSAYIIDVDLIFQHGFETGSTN